MAFHRDSTLGLLMVAKPKPKKHNVRTTPVSLKLRANVTIMGFDPGEEFSVAETETIRGLVNNGYLTELVPIISPVKLSEPYGD